MELKVGDTIKVFGWVMLRGLDEGTYRVSHITMLYGNPTYSFIRSGSRRIACRHYAADVDAWLRPAGHADNNRIEKN